MNEYSFTEQNVESKRILYTPSNFAKEDLLHLQEVGTLTALKPHESKRSHLKSYLLFVILHGSGSLVYKGISYPLKDGDCVFISCDEPYIHATGEDLWTIQWAHFYGCTMDGIYNKYCERGGQPVFRPVSKIPFAEALNKLYDTAGIEDYMRDMKINERLSSILTLIMENSWIPEKQTVGSSNRSSDAMSEIKRYIEIHYREKILLDNLAELFYMNKYHMVRSFKSRYGDTIINYLTSQRIIAAKKKLRFSDESVEEIGFECGFEDANYFSRAFKKMEGYSPSSYRNMWREK